MSVQGLIDRLGSIGADEQRVTIGLSVRRFCGGEIAASAGLVLDHHRVAKPRFKMLGQEPCRQIGASPPPETVR